MARKSTLVSILGLVGSLAAGSLSAHDAVRLVGGRWLVGDALVEQTMYIVDGRLREAAPETVEETVDLGGGIVVPPLGDAHSHGLADDRFDATSKRLLGQGIFYVQNPNSIRSWTIAARPRAADPATVDVTYAMAGVTSPGGHPSQIYDRAAAHLEGWTPERMRGEAYVPVAGEAGLEAAWPTVVAGSPDFVKAYLERSEHHGERRDDAEYVGRRGLDPALLPRLVELAHADGLRVSTHVTSRFDVRTAVAAGTDEISHLPLERLTTEDAAALAAAGVAVVTTVSSHRPTDGIDDLDRIHADNLRLLLGHGVRIVLGTDGDATVLDEAERLVGLGLDPAVVLRLATVDTPRWIFPDRAVGSLVDGAEASFVVVPSDPRVDLGALRRPQLLVKQGRLVEPYVDDALPGIGQRLAHLLMRDGPEAAVAEYRRLRSDEPDSWDFSEGQLNALGYAALEHGAVAAAVAVFRLNAEQYPGSANVWDSLGDGLVEAGDPTAAGVSWERALEIDPAAEHTREKLRALGERGEGEE